MQWQAPEPLLPNYGAGSIRLYHQDLQMMMAYNARERTTAEVVQIAWNRFRLKQSVFSVEYLVSKYHDVHWRPSVQAVCRS